MTRKLEETVFDRADLLERVQCDEELVNEILELFVEDGAHQIERINRAVGRGDASRVRSAAHALKGAASNVSAPALARAAFALESAARAGRLDDAADLSTRIEEEFARFKRALDG